MQMYPYDADFGHVSLLEIAYVANDPVNKTDPTGEQAFEKLRPPVDPDHVTTTSNTTTTANADGSETVSRTSSTQIPLRTGPVNTSTNTGTIKKLPQATAGGSPAPISDDMQGNLLDLSDSIGDQTVEVTSGFRSQAAQDAIRAAGNPRAAQRSSHTYNDAADIRVDGMTDGALADAAAATGDFARSNTYSNGGDVHVDQNTTARNQGRVCDYAPC